jgi:signal recognition particle subunit SEC65
MEPQIKDRKKFDIDLAYGKVREQRVADMLQNGKIEVKTERGNFSNPKSWVHTGNIAIEFESYGKPSGINATESDYWFHNLDIGDETFATVVFNTQSLKRIINKLDYSEVDEVYVKRVGIVYHQKANPLRANGKYTHSSHREWQRGWNTAYFENLEKQNGLGKRS